LDPDFCGGVWENRVEHRSKDADGFSGNIENSHEIALCTVRSRLRDFPRRRLRNIAVYDGS